VLRKFTALIDEAPTPQPPATEAAAVVVGTLELANNTWTQTGRRFDVNSYYDLDRDPWRYELYQTQPGNSYGEVVLPDLQAARGPFTPAPDRAVARRARPTRPTPWKVLHRFLDLIARTDGLHDADVSAEILDRLRPICLGLPETYEQPVWIGKRWRIRQHTFRVRVQHRALWRPPGRPVAGADRSVCRLTFRSAMGEITALLAGGHSYHQPDWATDVLGMIIDDDTDWDEVGELLTESYCLLAPKKLTTRVTPVLQHRGVATRSARPATGLTFTAARAGVRSWPPCALAARQALTARSTGMVGLWIMGSDVLRVLGWDASAAVSGRTTTMFEPSFGHIRMSFAPAPGRRTGRTRTGRRRAPGPAVRGGRTRTPPPRRGTG
jgi:hypothetical protein